MDSRFIHIADSDIQTGDDSLALFGVEDFTITNCTLTLMTPPFALVTRAARFETARSATW